MQPSRELPFAPHDRHAVEPVAQRRVPRGRGPDEIPAQLVPRGPAVDEHAIGAVARDQVALGRPDEHAGRGIVAARRLAADEVPHRAVRDEDAVPCVAASQRAAGVRPDVVHRDLVERTAVNPDAVAAVAADDVRELEARVHLRLEREGARGPDDLTDHRVAGHRVGAGDGRGRIDARIVQVDPPAAPERTVGVAPDRHPRALCGVGRAGLDRVGDERVNPLLVAADPLEVGDVVLADQPVRVIERRPVRELPGREVVVHHVAVAQPVARLAGAL